MQTRRRSSLLRNGIKIASANASVVEPQQQRQKVVARSMLEQKKATDTKTTSSKMPPPSNANKSNSSGGGSIGKTPPNSTKIVVTSAAAGQSSSNSTSAASAAESPTPLSKTNRIWWRYFTPINELWLLRIRCNNCDWECSMRRGELKFQQLQWHLIGTHPQLWRQKCRDEANENDGMPNLVKSQNAGESVGQKEPKKEEANEGDEGQREMEGKKRAANAGNVAKEDAGQMATAAHVHLQEVKQETPDKDATATAIAVKIANVQLQMKEKTGVAQNVEQTVIKQEPPFDEDQWDMEEMRIIPEICAEVGGDEQQQEEEEGDREEEIGDEPPNDGIGTKNSDNTQNANNAGQNATKKAFKNADAVKNVAPAKLAVLMPSSFAKARLSGIGTNSAAGGTRKASSLPFELASMPSTSIEIGVGPQQQQQQATGKYDYPDEYSYCILCGKKLADFYVMRLHLRRQHNYLITLDALREKVARFWADPRASANLFNQRHMGIGMKQGRTEFSKKYSQCTVCYRVLCDFYYLYNHMWTQHGYRGGREQLREEIIRHWGLEQANPLEDDNVERIHPFQLMERNDEGDEEVEADFMEFGQNEGIAEDRENEDGEEGDAEMPELFTEESSARSTADEEEDGGGNNFEGQDEGGDGDDAFGEFDEHPPAKKRPKLTEKSPKREVPEGEKEEEDASSNLPPKLPMMAKKSTILASKIAERRRHQQQMMDKVKPATNRFSQMDISRRRRQPTNLDNMMIARPVKPPNSKWLRISPTLGLTNTFFMRFLDRQDLRGTRPVLRVVNYSQNVLKLYDGTLACDCHLSPELKRTALDRGISTFFAPGIRVMLTDFRQIYNRNAQIGRVQPILVINHMRRLDIDIKNYSMIKAAEQQEQKQRQTAGPEKGGGDQQKPSSSSSGIGATAGTGTTTTMFNRAQNIVPCMRLPREQQQLRRILFGHLPTRLRPYYPPLKPVSAELRVQRSTKEKETAPNTGSSPIKFYSIESPPKLVPSQQHQKKMPSSTPAAGMAPKLVANSSAPVAANLATPIKEECPQLVKEEYYEGGEQQGVTENQK